MYANRPELNVSHWLGFQRMLVREMYFYSRIPYLISCDLKIYIHIHTHIFFFLLLLLLPLSDGEKLKNPLSYLPFRPGPICCGSLLTYAALPQLFYSPAWGVLHRKLPRGHTKIPVSFFPTCANKVMGSFQWGLRGRGKLGKWECFLTPLLHWIWEGMCGRPLAFRNLVGAVLCSSFASFFFFFFLPPIPSTVTPLIVYPGQHTLASSGEVFHNLMPSTLSSLSCLQEGAWWWLVSGDCLRLLEGTRWGRGVMERRELEKNRHLRNGSLRAWFFFFLMPDD